MKFRRRTKLVDVERVVVEFDFEQLDGKVVPAIIGDWIVDDSWIFSDQIFRMLFEPIDDEARKQWQIKELI